MQSLINEIKDAMKSKRFMKKFLELNKTPTWMYDRYTEIVKLAEILEIQILYK